MNINQNPNIIEQVLSKLQFSGFTQVQEETIVDWINYRTILF